MHYLPTLYTLQTTSKQPTPYTHTRLLTPPTHPPPRNAAASSEHGPPPHFYPVVHSYDSFMHTPLRSWPHRSILPTSSSLDGMLLRCREDPLSYQKLNHSIGWFCDTDGPVHSGPCQREKQHTYGRMNSLHRCSVRQYRGICTYMSRYRTARCRSDSLYPTQCIVTAPSIAYMQHPDLHITRTTTERQQRRKLNRDAVNTIRPAATSVIASHNVDESPSHRPMSGCQDSQHNGVSTTVESKVVAEFHTSRCT